MVYKDPEGTAQARRELAEKERKLLQALQGKKPTTYQMFSNSYKNYNLINDSVMADDDDSDAELLGIFPKGLMPVHKGYSKPQEMVHLKALLEKSYDPIQYPTMNTTSAIMYDQMQAYMAKVKNTLEQSLDEPIDQSDSEDDIAYEDVDAKFGDMLQKFYVTYYGNK